MIRFRQMWSSVFVKFSGAFIAVGIIPLFALSLFSLQTFTGHVERHTVNNLKQMTMYMSFNLNNAFSQYNEITKLMYTSNVGSSFSTLTNQTLHVNELEQINQTPIQDFLKTIVNSDPNIRSAFFVRELDGKLYFETKQGTAFLAERLPLDQWMQPLRDNPTQLAIHLTHPSDYFFNSDRHVFTIGRTLIDISGPVTANYKVVGSLFIDVDSVMFDELFKELSLNSNDELCVLDHNDYVYYSNRAERVGTRQRLADQLTEDRLVISEPLNFINGRVILRISKQDLFEQLTSTRTAVYTAVAICALVLIVMGAWFSRRLATPIRRIIKQMIKVESGNLDTHVENYGNDEIGRLAHGFNRMVERLNAFINEAYVAELGRKQAELSALKSQIRPHYLYNTLEVIRMNAVHNDDAEVADMILSLSNQLKYVIDYGEEWVSIEREIGHLRDYFYIISVRFENRFDLRVHIDPDVNPQWQILKLSLQPIVENAIQHGIRPKGGKGSVLVAIERIGEMLAVTVYDDGVGMEEEEVQRLTRYIHRSGEVARNVGMKNVHERIRSMCGEPYGLEINSRIHVGTSIRLTMPIRKEEHAYGDSSRAGG